VGQSDFLFHALGVNCWQDCCSFAACGKFYFLRAFYCLIARNHDILLTLSVAFADRPTAMHFAVRKPPAS